MNNQFSRKNPFKISKVYSLVFIFVFANQIIIPFRPTRQNAQWSPPETIPLYQLGTLPPILVADQNRTVHAFSSQLVDVGGGKFLRVIFYNQWSLERGWTIPVDIIISPNKEARVTDVFLDKNSIFHLVFFGGDQTSANIYYSQAPATMADNSLAWSTPIIIGENAGDPENAAIVEDDNGALSVVYSGREFGNGLYGVNSTDGGENWSDPTPIFLTRGDASNISMLHVIKSESGWLHAVWGVFDIGGQGRGIYYTRSRDGIKWSEPFLLADAQDGLGTQTPTIIEYKKTLYALYNMTPKITMRRSSDEGKTWDDPSIIFPRHVGVNGSLSLVIDGNNQLHLFFGQRISGNPDIHGLWHSTLLNSRWTEPDALIKGPRIVDKEGLTGFDPYDARAVVSQGNVLLVTWRTDPGDIKDNGIWYSHAVINAPETPISTLESYYSISETPSALTSPVPTLFLESTLPPNMEQEPQTRGNFVWIILSVILGFLLVVFILFNRSR
jgi:hypothetical protein